MATTTVSILNPLEFYDEAFVQQAQFKSKNINDVPFVDTIYDWDQPTLFKQIFQLNDSIRLQVRSETGPITWKLYTCTGSLVTSNTFDQLQENADAPGEFVYQADIDLSIFSAGIYIFKIEIGSAEKTLFSEPIEFSESYENSLLLQYSNSSFKDDILFELSFNPVIRLKGRLFYKQPGSKDTVFEDQVLNETIISSSSFDLWELQLSDEFGIPDWLIRKLNMILGCDEIIIDGRYFTKSEGSKLEPNAVEGYPMRGWKVELREQLNRRSKYYTSSGTTNLGIAVVLNTDSKGFVADDTGGSVYQITDIN